MGEGRGGYRLLLTKPEGRRPLARLKRRWKDNMKTGVREVGWGINWIYRAQSTDRWRAVVNAVMNLAVGFFF
jgi:hypothetical protein